VNSRLALETVVGLEDVTAGSPGVRGGAGNLAVFEMTGSGAAVLRCQLELGCGFVVKPRRRVERVAQFQTLTSR
jgi:hypothetical protein